MPPRPSNFPKLRIKALCMRKGALALPDLCSAIILVVMLLLASTLQTAQPWFNPLPDDKIDVQIEASCRRHFKVHLE